MGQPRLELGNTQSKRWCVSSFMFMVLVGFHHCDLVCLFFILCLVGFCLCIFCFVCTMEMDSYFWKGICLYRRKLLNLKLNKYSCLYTAHLQKTVMNNIYVMTDHGLSCDCTPFQVAET